jgi:hypothetical protein
VGSQQGWIRRPAECRSSFQTNRELSKVQLGESCRTHGDSEGGAPWQATGTPGRPRQPPSAADLNGLGLHRIYPRPQEHDLEAWLPRRVRSSGLPTTETGSGRLGVMFSVHDSGERERGGGKRWRECLKAVALGQVHQPEDDPLHPQSSCGTVRIQWVSSAPLSCRSPLSRVPRASQRPM